jgi:hypothetical protein
MKLLKSLLGKDKDEKPTWNIMPPSKRPPARRTKTTPVANTDVNPVAQNTGPATPDSTASKKEPHPFMDDPMLDTMTLEVDLTTDDDPYSTHSWTTGLENETRKLKTIQVGTKSEKKPSADFNPYDTGKIRRSWKKE